MKFTCRVLLFLFVVLLLSQDVDAAPAGRTKIFIGLGLIGGGGVIAANGIQESICFFRDCPSHDAEIIAGLGMVGVGTVLFIMGLRERGRAGKSEFEESLKTRPELLFGAAPTRHGFAAGVTFRW